MSKIPPSGRLLLRKPRLYRSCSAEEEEEDFVLVLFIFALDVDEL
jgi:hypothetical protein